METNTEKVSLKTCMADGVKLFIKNIPFIFVFGLAAHLLLILNLRIIDFLRWNYATVQNFGQRTYMYDGIFYFLSTHSLIFHILLSIIFNLVTLMGTILIISKSLAILRQEDFSLKLAFKTIRPNVLKLIVVGTIMYILSSARIFAWHIIFWLFESSIIDTIPRITMPWMRTRTRETLDIHGNVVSEIIVTEQIMAITIPVNILISAIGMLVFTGIGLYMMAHIVGRYENGFIRGAFSAAKRTIVKMFIFSVVLTSVMTIATYQFHLIPMPIFAYIILVLTVTLQFYSVTTFTALYFHATEKIDKCDKDSDDLELDGECGI